MMVYACEHCSWKTEFTDWPGKCKRCGGVIFELDIDTIVALIDKAALVYCQACNLMHSGPMEAE